MSTTEQRVALAIGEGVAGEILNAILPACEQATIAGSIRRRAPDVGDVEILAIPRRRQRIVTDGFFDQREVIDDDLRDRVDELIGTGLLAPHPTDPKRGERYSKLLHPRSGLQVDLFSVRTSTWGIGLLIRTGPAAYSHWFVNEARRRGYHVADGFQLHRGGMGCGSIACEVIPTPEEDEVYRILGLPFVEPARRGQP
jgi:DNA polymerase/3'-5' exonuclease PolX